MCMFTILLSSAIGSWTVQPFSGQVSLYSKANKGNLWERGNAYCCSFSKTFLREWFSWKGTRYHKTLALYLITSVYQVKMKHTLSINQQSKHCHAKPTNANTLSNISHTSLMVVVWLKLQDKVTIHRLHTELMCIL